MNSLFKKMDGTKIDNVVEYINNYFDSRKGEFKLYIGTDSQKTGKTVSYATVICLYTVGKGAHIIYKKLKRTDIKDIYTRLWNEVEYSMEVANFLRDNKLLLRDDLMSVHLDISSELKNKSNAIYSSAMGLFKGSGFDVKTKPDAYVASYAADLVCRN